MSVSLVSSGLPPGSKRLKNDDEFASFSDSVDGSDASSSSEEMIYGASTNEAGSDSKTGKTKEAFKLEGLGTTASSSASSSSRTTPYSPHRLLTDHDQYIHDSRSLDSSHSRGLLAGELPARLGQRHYTHRQTGHEDTLNTASSMPISSTMLNSKRRSASHSSKSRTGGIQGPSSNNNSSHYNNNNGHHPDPLNRLSPSHLTSQTQPTLLTSPRMSPSSYEERSTWVQKVQQENPAIADIRDRVRPLSRTIAFARAFGIKPSYPNEDILTGQVPAAKRSESETVIGLVMQHLHAVGLHKTVAAIHQELDRLASSPHHTRSNNDAPSHLKSKDLLGGRYTRKENGKDSAEVTDEETSSSEAPSSPIHDSSNSHHDSSNSPPDSSRSSKRSNTDKSSRKRLNKKELSQKKQAESSSSGSVRRRRPKTPSIELTFATPSIELTFATPSIPSAVLVPAQYQDGSVSPVAQRGDESSRTIDDGKKFDFNSTRPASTTSGSDITSGGDITSGSDITSATFYRDQSFFENDRSESRLLTILRQSVRRAHEIWDIAIADKPTAVDDLEKSLEEKLYNLGLLEDEGNVVDDVDIWEEAPDSDEDLNTPTFISGRGGRNSVAISPAASMGTSSPALAKLRNGQGVSRLSKVMSLDDTMESSRKLIYDMYVEVEDDEERPIRAGTLNKLVEVATSSKLPDLNFLPTFLLTYRSFTTPKLLLEKLKQRFNVPFYIAEQKGLTVEAWRDNIVTPIQLRVISFIKRWLTDYMDDIDSTLLPEMRKFIESTAIANPSLKLLTNSTLAALEKRAAALRAATNSSGSTNTWFTNSSHTQSHGNHHAFSPYSSAGGLVLSFGLSPNSSNNLRKASIGAGPPPVPKVPKSIFDPNLTLYQIDHEEVARQLTILDSFVFISINASELLNQCWNKPKLKHQAPNVLKMVNMFNQLSHAISGHILQGPRPRDRAKIIEWWISVAEHCKNLNNFHGLMAVVSGINSGPTVRLRLSRREVSKSLMDKLNSYEAIFESDGNFSTYRTTLQNASPPLIPYLGVHLTDLTFIEEGNKDMQGHLINFAKRRLLYQTISALQNFQQNGYNLQPVRQIHDLIAALKPYESRDLFKLSLSIEPRER